MNQGPIKKVEKVWGFEEWWINEPEYCFKVLVIKPGTCSSKHYHPRKKETFLVMRGSCNLIVWDGGLELHHEMTHERHVTIEAGQPHQFYLEREAKEPCVIYEISMHHEDDDVVRQSASRQI